MRLYQLPWAIYPRRVLIYLAEKGISDLELATVDLIGGENRQPAFLAINPSGTLPVLEHEPGAYIRQSTAILEYFEETCPDPNMIGETPAERAATRDVMSLVNESYIHLLNYLGQASPLFAAMVDQKVDAAAAFHARYQLMIGNLERAAAADGPFLTGDRLTYADCAFFASAQFADTLYREPLPDACPRLRAVYDRFASRASAAVPDYPGMIRAAAPVPR